MDSCGAGHPLEDFHRNDKKIPENSGISPAKRRGGRIIEVACCVQRAAGINDN